MQGIGDAAAAESGGAPGPGGPGTPLAATLEAEQRAGRGLLWDRPQDREAEAEFKAARVAQQPYVYQTRGH